MQLESFGTISPLAARAQGDPGSQDNRGVHAPELAPVGTSTVAHVWPHAQSHIYSRSSVATSTVAHAPELARVGMSTAPKVRKVRLTKYGRCPRCGRARTLIALGGTTNFWGCGSWKRDGTGCNYKEWVRHTEQHLLPQKIFTRIRTEF